MVKYELKDMTEALNLGFELIISAAFKGALSEERVRQFWIQDLAELSAGKKRSDSEAANVAIDAFTTLTLAGLASVDPLKLSQWIRDEAEKSA